VNAQSAALQGKSPPQDGPRWRARRVFAERGFRRLLATRLAGQLSDGVFQVALASYAFFSPERHASGGAVAAAFAVVLLPYSFLGPFAGVFIDRWQRRQILLVANVLRGLLAVIVAAVVFSPAGSTWFFVSALTVLSINRFVLSALSASLPHVVPDGLLLTANAISPTAGTIAAVTGGGLGVGLRVLVGGASDKSDALVITVAALLYVTAGVLALRLGRTSLGPQATERIARPRKAITDIGRGLIEGLRHLGRRPLARDALTVIAVNRFFYGIQFVATLLLYRNYFEDPSKPDAGLAGFAIAVSASGVGYLTGAVLTPTAVRRFGRRGWVSGLLIAAAVSVVAFAMPYTEPLLVVCAFVLGVSAQGIKVVVDTTVQAEIDDVYRGRVFSVYDVMFNVTFVAAAVVAATVLPTSGKSYVALTCITIGYVVAAAWYWRQARPAL
jgi:MFS family permease